MMGHSLDTGGIIIAIDGLSACGKSTLAKDLANQLNYLHIDSGAMYRATTYFFLINKVDLDQPKQIEKALQDITLTFKTTKHKTSLILNGKLLEDQLRTQQVDELVSKVAAISAVRKKMVKIQQAMGQDKWLIMDGRDIGTVVFPNATLKIFLTASLEVRTQRRLQEISGRKNIPTESDVRDNLVIRDKIDSTRSDSPLVQAPDSVVIDNSNLTRIEQLVMSHALAKKRISKIRCD
ncbi:MAG: (d)CMP kinase [Saprospiraceae bacterium]|nr:(d)CMP kinase [Saprospiraceae bacterium]